MKIDLAIINNNQESAIYKFIMATFKFDVSMKNIDEINETTNKLTLIIVNKKNFEKRLSNLKRLLKIDCPNFIFLIPSSLKSTLNKSNDKIIYFPINIIDFDKIIYKHAHNLSIKFDCFRLTNQNLLFKNDNKYIYLTEPEAHIIKLLFMNKLVKKDQIKAEVLKLNIAVESKSLETHLYRLRKKLSQLSPNILIKSDDQNNLIITKTN